MAQVVVLSPCFAVAKNEAYLCGVSNQLMDVFACDFTEMQYQELYRSFKQGWRIHHAETINPPSFEDTLAPENHSLPAKSLLEPLLNIDPASSNPVSNIGTGSLRTIAVDTLNEIYPNWKTKEQTGVYGDKLRELVELMLRDVGDNPVAGVDFQFESLTEDLRKLNLIIQSSLMDKLNTASQE